MTHAGEVDSPMMSARSGAFGSRLVLTILAMVAIGCDQPTSGAGGACGSLPPCPAGSLCIGDVCLQLCNTDSDCDAADEVCSAGICDQVPFAGCDDAVDCAAPASCELVAGARCRGGECVYEPIAAGIGCDDDDLCTEGDACDGNGFCIGTPRLCVSPPDNTCSTDDATFTAYPSVGTCAGLGQCNYEPTLVPCAGCAVNCLQSCAGVTCPDLDGGCRTNGVCTGVGGANCNYSDAADRVACDLPGSAQGARDGVCSSGSCVGCVDAADCTDPPGGLVDCFTPTCTSTLCGYTPLSGVQCEPTECLDGFIYDARTCGTAGDCPVPSPPGSSCQGYACADATSCKNSCTTGADCAPGSNCLAGGNCQPPQDLGQSCTENGGCLSGFCADNICCDRTCDGTCERCDNTGGTAGSCHFAAAGSDPDDECTSTMQNCVADSCSGSAAACDIKTIGSDCGACRQCDNAGSCMADDTQHADCPICQKCNGGTCVIESSLEDIKGECAADAGCGTGNCNGAGSCSYVAGNTDCGICRRCNGSGSCAGNSSDHGDCGACEKCAGGTCANQSASEDLKTECSADAGCGSGNCDGGGACDYASSGANCGTCRSCNGSGSCQSNSSDHGDCGRCQKCVSGSCTNQTSSQDLKGECAGSGGCGTGNCNGSGACSFVAAGTGCATCTACDGSGSCNQALADDSACGTIDCDGLDSTSTCTNYNDLTTNRCEGAGNCKDANTIADCTSKTPYPASTVCRDNAGAQACDADEYCSGSGYGCPADDFAWVDNKMCSNGTLATMLTLATGREVVTGADRTACRNHCDTISNVTCCMVLGIPAFPPYVPDAMIYCYPYTGATSFTDSTIYDYWAAMCR